MRRKQINQHHHEILGSDGQNILVADAIRKDESEPFVAMFSLDAPMECYDAEGIQEYIDLLQGIQQQLRQLNHEVSE